MSWMIARIESSSPPGVSSRMIASVASSSAASSSALDDPPLGRRVDRRLRARSSRRCRRRVLGAARDAGASASSAGQRERAADQSAAAAPHGRIIRPGGHAQPRVALDVGGEVVLGSRTGPAGRRRARRSSRRTPSPGSRSSPRSPRRSPRRGRCSSGRAAGTREEVLGRLARVVGVDAEERDPLAESRGRALEPRELHPAGAAPRGPLVDHDRIAAQLGEPPLERLGAARRAARLPCVVELASGGGAPASACA